MRLSYFALGMMMAGVPGWSAVKLTALQIVSFEEPRTTDSLRPGGMGEFLARSSHACAACALRTRRGRYRGWVVIVFERSCTGGSRRFSW